MIYSHKWWVYKDKALKHFPRIYQLNIKFARIQESKIENIKSDTNTKESDTKIKVTDLLFISWEVKMKNRLQNLQQLIVKESARSMKGKREEEWAREAR